MVKIKAVRNKRDCAWWSMQWLCCSQWKVSECWKIKMVLWDKYLDQVTFKCGRDWLWRKPCHYNSTLVWKWFHSIQAVFTRVVSGRSNLHCEVLGRSKGAIHIDFKGCCKFCHKHVWQLNLPCLKTPSRPSVCKAWTRLRKAECFWRLLIHGFAINWKQLHRTDTRTQIYTRFFAGKSRTHFLRYIGELH